MKWERVTIIGCGLIGASFALALRRHNLCHRIAGWDADQSALAAALERGIIDEVDQAFAEPLSGEQRGVSLSGLIYLAMPVWDIRTFLSTCAAQIRDDAVVTDAGSTKREVCKAAHECLPNDKQFIGGHPIAGSHLTSNAHADGALFHDATYVLTTDNAEAESRAAASVSSTIEALGARVVWMSAAEHDRVIALTSHLPQLLSSALAATIEDQPNANRIVSLAGSGYRDMTRLAASSWSMWHSIFVTNSDSIADAINLIVAKLIVVRDELGHSRLEEECRDGDNDKITKTKSLFERKQDTRNKNSA